MNCSVDLNKPSEIKKIEAMFEKEAITNAKYTLEKLQKAYKSDIIGIGDEIHKQKPKLWKDLKADWDSHFENLEVEIKVEIKINWLGAIRGNLIDKIKK